MKSTEQSKEKLVIFDTTLRDGEQSPGASMTKDEKVRIAKALEKMGVDVIEAGFAISSQGDFEAIQAGNISITPIQLDLSAYKSMKNLKAWIE